MPALFGQRQQVRLAQAGEMLAGRLRRHAGDIGELARRQRAAVDQRHQNVGARRIADQRGDFGDGGLRFAHDQHISRTRGSRQSRQFGNSRSDAAHNGRPHALCVKEMEPDVNIPMHHPSHSQTGRVVSIASGGDSARRPRGRSARLAKPLTLAAMSLGYVVVQLDVTIVNVAINSIGADFGGSVADLQWIVNAYTITFAAFILTAGALGDRLGARRVFITGFAIFVLASLACALAPALSVLILARLCQGIGAAILVPNSLALLNHAYPEETGRHWAVGIWAAGASFSLTAGPLVGGALIALTGWRSIFFINLPIGLAGIWLTWRYATETSRVAARTLDMPGQMAAVLALGSLAAAMIEGGERGWTDAWVLAGFASFAVPAALFLLIEFRSKHPLLPLALFRKPAFSAMSLTGSLHQCRMLRLDLRIQPVFPAAQSSIAVVDWASLRAHDGSGPDREPHRRARHGGHRRTSHDHYGPHGRRGKLSRSTRATAGHALHIAVCAAHRIGRRARAARSANDVDFAWQRCQAIFRRGIRRTQCHASDWQRAWRCALWRFAGRCRRLYRRFQDRSRDLSRLGALRCHCCYARRCAAGTAHILCERRIKSALIRVLRARR